MKKEIVARFDRLEHYTDNFTNPANANHGMVVHPHNDVVILRSEFDKYARVIETLQHFEQNYADFDHHPEFRPVLAALKEVI